MQFGFWGLSYKSAGLDIRDKAAFTDSAKLTFLNHAESFGVEQCLLLSTCNRTEADFFFTHSEQYNQMKALLERTFPEVPLADCLNGCTGKDALAHLFAVTAGLESQVLGEDQILGQVKSALDFTKAMGFSKKELSRVVTDAVACAKRIKTELKISEIPLSVSYVGICQLKAACGIAGRSVLILGSGKMAALALRYVCDCGAGHVIVCSRTLSHAQALQHEFAGIRIIAYPERYAALQQSDIVISATSAPHLVLRSCDCTVTHPLYLLDLAAPRDIDPAFAQNPLCHLWDLDSLQQTVLKNQEQRNQLAEKSKAYIQEALEETGRWLAASRMDSTIASLQQRCREISDDSFQYLDRRLELTDHEQKIVRRTLDAALRRLLREPILQLKRPHSSEEQEQYKEVVRRLFQIEQEEHVS